MRPFSLERHPKVDAHGWLPVPLYPSLHHRLKMTNEGIDFQTKNRSRYSLSINRADSASNRYTEFGSPGR